MKRLIIGLAAMALLAGCSGVEKDARYETAIELRDAMTAAGYDCPSWDDFDTETTSFDSGHCLSDNRDQLRVYKTEQARSGDMDGLILGTQFAMVSTRVEMGLLVSNNWAIRAPKEEIPGLREKLGGFEPDLSDVRMPT
ncbi:hypothetical protein ACQCX2_07600 [Propionibacteriaceae bacterium Y1700]|uniref:hypothetical protein n=1 Tax=Microlunatus sp. Y1700 TaxID=3418487 RepID=UPI003DA6ED9A